MSAISSPSRSVDAETAAPAEEEDFFNRKQPFHNTDLEAAKGGSERGLPPYIAKRERRRRLVTAALVIILVAVVVAIAALVAMIVPSRRQSRNADLSRAQVGVPASVPPSAGSDTETGSSFATAEETTKPPNSVSANPEDETIPTTKPPNSVSANPEDETIPTTTTSPALADEGRNGPDKSAENGSSQVTIADKDDDGKPERPAVAPATEAATTPEPLPPSTTTAQPTVSTPDELPIETHAAPGLEGNYDTVKHYMMEGGISEPNAFDDPASPQSLAAKWLANEDEWVGRTAINSIVDTEALVPRYSLAVIFFSMGGPTSWDNPVGFMASDNICDWKGKDSEGKIDGVRECDDQNRVTNLNLAFNGVVGSIPKEIGNLRHLKRIWLHNNRLTGTIPDELWTLTDLTHLNLSENELSGSISEKIGSLSKLQRLWLNHNQFDGQLPSSMGSSLTDLKTLKLQHNNFSGNLPQSFEELTKLQRLCLEQNNFEGSMEFMCGAVPKLKQFDVDRDAVECNCCGGGLS